MISIKIWVHFGISFVPVLTSLRKAISGYDAAFQTHKFKIGYQWVVPQKGVIGCVFQHVLGRQGVCIPACIGQEVSSQGVSARGMSAWEAVSAQEGGCVCPWGVCPRRVSVQGGVADTPPWTESQMPVKTLPCRNYVADSKNDYAPVWI